MKRFLHLSISVDGTQLRNGSLNGTKYIIAPCVSKLGDNVEWPINAPAPEFIPSNVLALATHSRNNRPVVMGHPQDENGIYISANDPEILEKYSFGHMFAAKFEDERVQCEMWLDPERAKIVGKDAERVIERLQNGETIEVSEGDYVISEKQEGEWNGKKYGAIWVACWSDHLAVLPEGSIGACGIDDGCGGNRVSMGLKAASMLQIVSPLKVAALAQARRPTFTGTETSTWTKPTFADYVKYLYNGDDPPTSVSKCSAQMKKEIAAHTLLGDPDASNFADLTSHAVVNPSNGYLNEKALRTFLNDANETVKEMAKRLLNSEFSANLPNKKVEVEVSMDKKKENLFKRLISSMADTIRNSMSNNSLRWKLYKAIEKLEPGISYVSDEDLEAKTVIYCVVIRFGEYWSDENEYHWYQRTFSIDENENVTISDDAVEVEFFEGWKPLGKATPKMETLTNEPEIVASCGCHKGDKTMDRKSVINRLSNLTSGPFTGNVKALEAMDDKGLESLDKTYPDKIKEGEHKDTPVQTPTPAPTPTPPTPPVDQNTVSLSKEEHAELIAMRDAHRAQEQAKKMTLVASLKSAQTEFTETDLIAMETSQLERMSRLLKVDQPSNSSGNYLGLPIPRDISKPAMRELPDPLNLKAHGMRPDGRVIEPKAN
jgi:hypothetical protein